MLTLHLEALDTTNRNSTPPPIINGTEDYRYAGSSNEIERTCLSVLVWYILYFTRKAF